MTFTHALSTNNYGPSKFVVATSAANGTHTTLAAAMTAAVSGDTIFLRNSVTENVTITPGVNIVSYVGAGETPTVSITGKVTMTGAGSSTISGIRLITNSDFAIAVTGSAASVLYIENCYLNFTNNTGITFTTSNSSAKINVNNSLGDVGTTGITIFVSSSTGIISFSNCSISNSGASTTASTCSAGTWDIEYSNFPIPFSTTSTAGLICRYSDIANPALNTTMLTGNGSGGQVVFFSLFDSGTASAVSIGTGATLTLNDCVVSSSNTNAITGVGTLIKNGINFQGTSSVINTTTVTQRNLGVGGISFDGGTNTLATYTVGTFTPTLVGGSTAGSTTYSNQNGYYVRIGALVTIQGYVQGTAATGTGNAVLGAYPFTVKSQTNGASMGSIQDANNATWTWPAATTSMALQAFSNTTQGAPYVSGTATVGGFLQMANAAFLFQYTVTYEI